MSTGRDLVSRVRSINKLVNTDNILTDRAIYSELKSKSSLLIKREANLRRLWQSPNIFTSINCIEMQTVPLGECCDYKSPCEISKSVMKMPKIGEGIFGLLVQGVYNVANSESYKYSSPNRYVNILRMDLRKKDKFFWISNDHLYVTNPNIEAVNMIAYFDDEVDPSIFNSCRGLNLEDQNDICINPLDRSFKIPSYLEDSLVSMVNDSLNKIYFRHIPDTTPNNKDESR